MALAAGSPGMADANERTPSAASLHALDAVNLFLAAALAGFGFTCRLLASQNWTQQNIGFILSAAGLVGLPANCSTPSVGSLSSLAP
jgi:hypothetical protein